MLGLGDKHNKHIDATTLPIFVHALQSADAFGLAQKVWETNARYVVPDPVNGKELLRFVFSSPTCVVWLCRDRGRTDSFEIVLFWAADGKRQEATEVYVISTLGGAPVGDDSRIKDLLNAILTTPSIVPVVQNITS
jgi:hypothetical protein